jgi:tRNA(Arg) A34 adenosine deaminase TadA
LKGRPRLAGEPRPPPAASRRGLLALGLSAAFGPVAASARECDVCAVETPVTLDFEFVQPVNPSPEAYMGIARQAREFGVRLGNPAFGAAVVLNGMVVGAAPNRALSNLDPSAHAEIEAIRDACRRLSSPRLDGAVIYATARPCRMCEAAGYYAGVARIVHGDALTDAGAPRYEGC